MRGDKQHKSDKEHLADREWLTVTEAAAYLGVSRNTLYEAIPQGTVPGALRISPRRITINKQALIDASRAGTGSREV
jgi:excisionase family DNA binding protein